MLATIAPAAKPKMPAAITSPVDGPLFSVTVVVVVATAGTGATVVATAGWYTTCGSY